MTCIRVEVCETLGPDKNEFEQFQSDEMEIVNFPYRVIPL